MIVVTIIGILAAIAVPKLANASGVARENALKDNLRLLRTQIGVYRSQHNDVCPGFPNGDATQTPTQDALTNQLMKYSDTTGFTSATTSARYQWGPYILGMPENPVNGKSTWKMLGEGEPFTADGTTGWLYQPSTGIVKANVAGADSTGRTILEY
jgi:type II secretory pathway pseudopilin PulG